NCVFQAPPVQIFHGYEWTVVMLADLVDRADIWMAERRCRTGFTAETLKSLWILRYIIGQKLEGHSAAKAGIFRLINHPHAATAQFGSNAVMRHNLPNDGLGIGHGRATMLSEKTSPPSGERRTEGCRTALT